jgi:uncharacterized membrane protein
MRLADREPPAQRDRGVTLPLAALTITVVVLFVAFGIDISRVTLRNREMQKVADIAALDSARMINGLPAAELLVPVQAAAERSRERNDPAAVTLTTELGTWNFAARTFTVSGPTESPNAVRVTALDHVDFAFHPGSNTASRTAIAVNPDIQCTTLPCVPVPSPTTTASTTSTTGGATTTTTGGATTTSLVPTSTSTSICLGPLCPSTTTTASTATTSTTTCDPATCQGTTTTTSGCPPGTCVIAGEAGFSIGSSVATIDSSQATLLNRILQQTIAPSTTFTFTAAGWSGLAEGNVTLEELATYLPVNVGSPAALVTAGPIRVADLFLASAQALSNHGDPSNANILNQLAAAANPALSVNLGNMIRIGTGGEVAAAFAYIDLPQLITASAFLVNGSNFITVPGLNFGIPGVTSTTASIRLVEAPRYYFGPAGGGVSTNQATLTLTNVVTGGTLTVKTVGGNATGTLMSTQCGAGRGITTRVSTNAVTTTVTFTPAAGSAVTATKSDSGDSSSRFFSDPDQFDKGSNNPAPWTAGAHTLGLGGMAFTPPLPAVSALLGLIDNRIVSPVSRHLGLGFTGADLWARELVCQPPILVG